MVVVQNEMVATGAVFYASFVWFSNSKLFHRHLRPICLSLKPFSFWAVIMSLTYYRFLTTIGGQEVSLEQATLYINEQTLTDASILHYVFFIYCQMVKQIPSRLLALSIGDTIGVFMLYTILERFDNIFRATMNINILNIPFRFDKYITTSLYNIFKKSSFMMNLIKKEQSKIEESFDKELKVKSRSIATSITCLPNKGIDHKDILDLMVKATKTENVPWETGRVSGAVYHGQHEHIHLLNAAFGMYSISNPLHPDIWPSVMKFESEIIAMTAALVSDADVSPVFGSTTSGGTESIILAIKAHRDFYREHYNIDRPEMVVGVSAHAAVDKACDMLGIKLIKVVLDPVSFSIDLTALKRALTPNTIMMYASAPSYPHGAIDPVRAMGRIAVERGIGLHVDCCLGGFILPFAKMLRKNNIPDFDFRVPGVSSMSMDTHKYGYALKGASVVLYKSKELRHSQYFCYADWTGGMYTTPTIAGSRSGGLIAQCWASLMALGREGYLRHAEQVLQVAANIKEGVQRVQGLTLLGPADAMIVCFTGKDGLNIYSVGDNMSKKGWCLNALQQPPCLHICCTVTHVGQESAFLSDLQAAVDEARTDPAEKEGKAAIYGMTSSLPAGPVNELLKVYNDVVLKV